LLSRYEGQTEAAQFKIPFYVWLLAALLAAALAAWAFFAWRDQRRWNAYVETLRGQPGFVITEEGKRHGKHYVAGLRDPLADKPESFLPRHEIDPADVDLQNWKPYQASDKSFVERRAQSLLAPPPGVNLRFNEDGTLEAAGEAPIEWIRDARRFALALPGVANFDDRSLASQEARRIEARVIRFVAGGAQLVAGQEEELQALIADLQKISRTAQVEIIGHTDTEGSESTNQRLSEARASRILSMLAAKGIDKTILSARGVASGEPVRAEASEADKQFNRSVSFKVLFNEASK
jgi:OOP family OmpA-OmpF porin